MLLPSEGANLDHDLRKVLTCCGHLALPQPCPSVMQLSPPPCSKVPLILGGSLSLSVMVVLWQIPESLTAFQCLFISSGAAQSLARILKVYSHDMPPLNLAPQGKGLEN